MMPDKKPVHAKSEQQPWYRVGMVWLVILLPLAVVLASMFTIVIAHKNAPVLINQQVDANNASRSVTEPGKPSAN